MCCCLRLRRVLPFQRSAGLGKVEGVKDVWIGRYEIHRVVDDESRRFLPFIHAHGECECDLKLRDILRVDFRKLTIAGAREVLRGHGPLTIIRWGGSNRRDDTARRGISRRNPQHRTWMRSGHPAPVPLSSSELRSAPSRNASELMNSPETAIPIPRFQKQLQDRAATGGWPEAMELEASLEISIAPEHFVAPSDLRSPTEHEKAKLLLCIPRRGRLTDGVVRLFGPAQGSELCSPSRAVALKQARSIVSEASFSTELYARGKTTGLFNSELLQQANDELTSARETLRGNDEVVALVDAAQSGIQSGNSVNLRALADELRNLERANGLCP